MEKLIEFRKMFIEICWRWRKNWMGTAFKFQFISCLSKCVCVFLGLTPQVVSTFLQF